MNNEFLSSISLASLALAFISILSVSVVMLFVPNPFDLWKRFHTIKQEKMPKEFWYKVLEVIRKDGKITLRLQEDFFLGKKLYCLLHEDAQEDEFRKGYIEHILSKIGLDLCISFSSYKREDGEIIYGISYSYDTNEMFSLPHILWRLRHYR